MGIAEIIKIAASFLFVTTLTILVERYISDKAAIGVFLLSLLVLGWLGRGDLSKMVMWSHEHRQLAIVVLVVVFAAIGLGVGIWVTKGVPTSKTPRIQIYPTFA